MASAEGQSCDYCLICPVVQDQETLLSQRQEFEGMLDTQRMDYEHKIGELDVVQKEKKVCTCTLYVQLQFGQPRTHLIHHTKLYCVCFFVQEYELELETLQQQKKDYEEKLKEIDILQGEKEV